MDFHCTVFYPKTHPNAVAYRKRAGGRPPNEKVWGGAECFGPFPILRLCTNILIYTINKVYFHMFLFKITKYLSSTDRLKTLALLNPHPTPTMQLRI